MRFSCGHLSLGAVADSDTEQVFKLEGEIAEFPCARALAPYLRENGNPSIPVMPVNLVKTLPYARSSVRTLGEGEGSQ